MRQGCEARQSNRIALGDGLGNEAVSFSTDKSVACADVYKDTNAARCTVLQISHRLPAATPQAVGENAEKKNGETYSGPTHRSARNMDKAVATSKNTKAKSLPGPDGGTRVLVVEDDRAISEAIREGLTAAGFVVCVAATGAEALSLWQRLHPEAIVLDLLLPDMDGLDVCKAIRREDVVPLIITSGRDAETDRVCGLEVGADDYLCKPYEVEELAARLGALLSRCRRYAGRQPAEGSITVGKLVLDRNRYEALLAGRRLDLTPKEFDLLWVLAREAGRTLSARQLLWEVWGYDENIRTRTLDVHIGRLRRKLGDSAARPEIIVTVPTVGYRLQTPTRPASRLPEKKREREAAHTLSAEQLEKRHAHNGSKKPSPRLGQRMASSSSRKQAA